MTDRIRDGSVVVTAVERTLCRLRTAAGTARLRRVLLRSVTHPLRADAETDDTEPTRESRAGAVTRGSTVANALEHARDRVEATLRTGSRNARVAAAGGTGRRYVRGSFCYRWLTAEPDPDVIVIDLRETASVGPPLRALRRTFVALAPSVATARLTDATHRVVSLFRARPVRVASLLLFGAVAAGTVALAAGGDPAPVPMAALVALAVLAALGIRSRTDWEELRESRIATALVAAFEPPEPPARVDATDGQTVEDSSDTSADGDTDSETEPR